VNRNVGKHRISVFLALDGRLQINWEEPFFSGEGVTEKIRAEFQLSQKPWQLTNDVGAMWRVTDKCRKRFATFVVCHLLLMPGCWRESQSRVKAAAPSYPAVRQLGNSSAIMSCKRIRDCRHWPNSRALSSSLGCNPERVIPPLTCFQSPPEEAGPGIN